MKFKEFLQNSSEIISQPIPWSDLEFSRRSLNLHLDQENDVNSRRQFIIEKHVNWIHSFILNTNNSKILELACGPGLYLSKLANFGHNCTGVDISPAAIKYAKSKSPSNCKYFCEDILQFSTSEKFDLIFINFSWFHNFQKTAAIKLLVHIKSMLSSDGKLLLELLPFNVIKNYGEDFPQWHRTNSGIFSDEPYLFLQKNHWMENKKLAKLIYFIVNSDKTIQSFHQLYQAYLDNEFEDLLTENGFSDFQYFSNICDEDDFSEELYFLLGTKS